MDRLTKLRALIQSRFDGRIVDFSREIGRSPSQVSQWLGRHRRIGDAACRHIEIALKLPQGWFDDRNRVCEPVAEYGATVAHIERRLDSITREALQLMIQTDEPGKMMALAAIRIALSGHAPRREKKAG